MGVFSISNENTISHLVVTLQQSVYSARELSQSSFINEVINSESGLDVTLNNKINYYKLFSILSKYPDIQKIYEKEMSLETLFLHLIKK